MSKVYALSGARAAYLLRHRNPSSLNCAGSRRRGPWGCPPSRRRSGAPRPGLLSRAVTPKPIVCAKPWPQNFPASTAGKCSPALRIFFSATCPRPAPAPPRAWRNAGPRACFSGTLGRWDEILARPRPLRIAVKDAATNQRMVEILISINQRYQQKPTPDRRCNPHEINSRRAGRPGSRCAKPWNSQT